MVSIGVTPLRYRDGSLFDEISVPHQERDKRESEISDLSRLDASRPTR
jgi:hypothetical protein